MKKLKISRLTPDSRYLQTVALKLLSIKFDNLQITKSKKTLASYEKYWNHINRLIGDKIKKIINE